MKLTESALRKIVREEAAALVRRKGPTGKVGTQGSRKGLTEALGGADDMSGITAALRSYMTTWMSSNNVVDGAVNGDYDLDAGEMLESQIMSHVQDVVGEFIETNIHGDDY